MATFSSSSRSSSCHREPRILEGALGPSPPEDGKKTEEEEERDWAELPCDALSVVLHKLNHIDVLMGAGLVCRPWRRAARDEPELWRRVHMRFHGDLKWHLHKDAMACTAVRRSAGQCEAFLVERAGSDIVLSLLGDSAPSLKSLLIINSDKIVDQRLKLVITKFAMLEELELTDCTDRYPRTCETVSNACPLLKSLRLNRYRFLKSLKNVDEEAVAIATIRGLRSLQLFAQPLSNNGLVAILDGCTRLEFLDIRHCFNVEMDDEMRAKCSRIKTLRLPHDWTGDYDRMFSYPNMDVADPWADSANWEIDWEFSSR